MCCPEAVQQVQKSSSNAAKQRPELSKDQAWIESLDLNAFRSEIQALGKRLEKEQGPADVDHLNKMIGWSNGLAALGLLTMGFGIHLVPIVGLSLYTFSRWTMIAHHTCHGGYEKCHPQSKGRWSRFKFGLGSLWNRFNDWFDWMMPEAWNVEHNNRHHYNLSETTDPDLVEQNLETVRDMNVPVVYKYLVIFAAMFTWKWFYYSPNTYKELKLAQLRREGKKVPAGINSDEPVTIRSCLSGENPFYSFSELMMMVLGPYFVIHFLLTPLPWLLVGHYMEGYTASTMYCNAVCNLFLAELLTNAHGFLAVVTNHAGNDLYRFRKPCRPFSGSFYLRQVLASVDYDLGTDVIDFGHGWLNYQIEHHLWPSLSMLSYRKAAPQVQDICRRHKVPYIQHNVFWRLKKTVDIMVGKDDMQWFPEYYENKFLELDAFTMEQDAQKQKDDMAKRR